MFAYVNSIEPVDDSAKERERVRGIFKKQPIEPANIPDDPPSIKGRFYVVQSGEKRKYYYDFQQKHLAITASTKAIRTNLNDKETVAAVLGLAQARGWKSIRARGSMEFRSEAWVEGQVRGLKVEGYEPTETDKQEVAKRRAAEESKAASAAAKPVEKPRAAAYGANGFWKDAAESGAKAAAANGTKRARVKTNGVTEHMHA